VKHVDVQNADGTTTPWTWAGLKAWAKSNIADSGERQDWLRVAGQAYLDENGVLLAWLLGEIPEEAAS